jgi:hypothetical protein
MGAVSNTNRRRCRLLTRRSFALFFDRPWVQPMPGMAAWIAIASAGVFCTALGYALYFRILATAGATNLLLVTLLMPVGAVFLGMAVLGEQINAGDFVGTALIGFGLLAIDGGLGIAQLTPCRADSGLFNPSGLCDNPRSGVGRRIKWFPMFVRLHCALSRAMPARSLGDPNDAR